MGRSPLSFAAGFGHKGIVELLLAREDVAADSRDDAGRTPLSYAAECGREEIVALLLERGDVQINARCLKGRAPTDYAREMGHDGVVHRVQVAKSARRFVSDVRSLGRPIATSEKKRNRLLVYESW